MTPWSEIEDVIERPGSPADELLRMGECVLENWVEAHGKTPTRARREGFRLLALHAQGAKGDPSFNACRETCREIAYHYNLLTMPGSGTTRAGTLAMMALLANHLMLFVRGKMEVAKLGEFCCSSKSLRSKDEHVFAVGSGG
jgi:hypothetical protein